MSFVVIHSSYCTILLGDFIGGRKEVCSEVDRVKRRVKLVKRAAAAARQRFEVKQPMETSCPWINHELIQLCPIRVVLLQVRNVQYKCMMSGMALLSHHDLHCIPYVSSYSEILKRCVVRSD